LLAMCGCAQSVGYPDPDPHTSATDTDASALPAVEAGPASREGPYFGDYVVANGGGGEMMLSVKDDGFVTLTPADPYAAATGTIDEAGNVDVTTKFDTVADSVLHFTGVVKFDGVSWRASGKVVAQYSPNQPGTWAAVRK